MIELKLQIDGNPDTEKINIELIPNSEDSNAIERDVLSGLFPLITELLSKVLGGEGFKRTDGRNEELSSTEQESKIVTKYGAPASIPMTEEYLREKGLIEPENGPEPIDKSSIITLE